MNVAKVGIQFSPPLATVCLKLTTFQYILEVIYRYCTSSYAPDEVWGWTSLWFLCYAGTFVATSDYNNL